MQKLKLFGDILPPSDASDLNPTVTAPSNTEAGNSGGGEPGGLPTQIPGLTASYVPCVIITASQQC